MSTPFLSVVTISFNQARFLEEAIKSVLDQDYPNVEYIVVDPGSTDGSREIIECYRDRLAHIIYEKDNGPADGLNKGLARCTGEFFCYLNSDDFFLPGAFRRATEILSAHPDIDFVNGDAFIVDEDGKALRRFISAPFNLWRYAYGHSVVAQQSTFFRRSTVIKAGGFKNNCRVEWDAELLLRIIRGGGKSLLVHEYWSTFRLHDASITCSQHLRAEHDRTHNRFFHTLTGRDPRWFDKPVYYLAKLIRWGIDPVGFLERVKPLKELEELDCESSVSHFGERKSS